MHLYPGQKAIVIDTTRAGVPLPTSGDHADRVDAMVSHLLELGLHLCFDFTELRPVDTTTRWHLMLHGDEAFTLVDPEGIEALMTDQPLVDVANWLQLARGLGMVALYTGTDLFDQHDALDIERAQMAGTLVSGWALLADDR